MGAVMGGPGWEWDPSLYEGAASYYVRGRVPYPSALVVRLLAELEPGGKGRLLDVGCGPGSLTLRLAPHFERVVGVDADEHMLEEAERQAAAAGIRNVEWVHARAEDMATSLGSFSAVTMAQSFHWMDRQRVAGLLRQLLDVLGRQVGDTRLIGGSPSSAVWRR